MPPLSYTVTPTRLRVACLHQPSQPPDRFIRLLRQIPQLQLLAVIPSDDSPTNHWRDLHCLRLLQTELILLKLPLQSWHILRWLLHLHQYLPHAKILMVASETDFCYQEPLLSSEADAFIPFPTLVTHLSSVIQLLR